MAKKVKVELDETIEKNALVPQKLVLRTTDGKVYTKEVAIMKGDPGKPLTFEEFCKKFSDCAAFAVKPMTSRRIDEVIETIRDLEKIDNVAQLINVLNDNA